MTLTIKKYKNINNIVNKKDPIILLLHIAEDIQCINKIDLYYLYKNKEAISKVFPGWYNIITNIFMLLNNVSLCVDNIMDAISIFYPQWGTKGPCGGKTVKNTIFQMCNGMVKQNKLVTVWRDTKKGNYYKLNTE